MKKKGVTEKRDKKRYKIGKIKKNQYKSQYNSEVKEISHSNEEE